MGNLPWVEDGGHVRKMWYEVAGGTGYVELAADAVMFSVEATYHRSHCWLAARRWEGLQGASAPPPEDAALSPLEPPRSVFPAPDPLVQGRGTAAGLSSTSPPPLMQSPPMMSPAGGPSPPLVMARDRIPSRGSANRSSIALGLEPMAMPPDDGHARGRHHQKHPSFGAAPRVASHSNLRGQATAQAHHPHQQHHNQYAQHPHQQRHARSASAGPRPFSVPRHGASRDNLHVSSRDSIVTTDSGNDSPSAGVTFDDILPTPPAKMKKKSRFF
jgi:hypothetical protein